MSAPPGSTPGSTPACDPTLTHNVQNYVLPVFVSIFFFMTWGMTLMKNMKGSLTASTVPGGWCRLFLMVACFYQAVVAFFATFTILELETAPYMIYPLIGFIAFSSNNQRWLLLYIGTCLFAYKYSGAMGARGSYIDIWKQASASEPDVKYCSDYCDSIDPDTTCATCPGNDFLPGTFCKWGWMRTMNVLSMFGYWAFWLTTFGACSWWAEGALGGASGEAGGAIRYNAGNVAGTAI